MCAIEVSPVIATERLVLRRLAKTDAPRIAELANDVDVARMTTAMPYPYDLDHAYAFLGKVAESDPDREPVFAIDRDAELIGVMGFSRADNGTPEIGYWLGRPYWGRGYATEATRATLDWAARDWRRRVVMAGHFADNDVSGGVLVKAGFLYTGEVVHRTSAARGGEAAPTRMMVWLP